MDPQLISDTVRDVSYDLPATFKADAPWATEALVVEAETPFGKKLPKVSFLRDLQPRESVYIVSDAPIAKLRSAIAGRFEYHGIRFSARATYIKGRPALYVTRTQ